MVGAVVLDAEGHVAGEGYHREAGQPHAEEEALSVAGDRSRDGTLYVNLEPCAHEHRSPSCAQLVIDAGLRRVVIAMTDPDERVRGAGLRMLENAGIEIDVGVHDERAQKLNEFYVKHRLTGRPFVTAKFAMSLDGKIATRTGESQLRIRQSARIVGSNTLIATTRHGRVGAAEVLRLPAAADGRVALPALLDELGQRGILSLLVEGGAEVHASFFAEGLVDKVYAYVAPRLIGGREAPGPLGGDGVEKLAAAIHLNDLDFVRFGDDLAITGYVDVHRDS